MLRQEMTRRGWAAIDLARAARLSPATVSAALAGRPIAASSVALIAKALASAPPDEIIGRLLRDEWRDRAIGA
jgi:transcriptional regulator with XRE-family HTH domain